jgi:hypothetical protein
MRYACACTPKDMPRVQISVEQRRIVKRLSCQRHKYSSSFSSLKSPANPHPLPCPKCPLHVTRQSLLPPHNITLDPTSLTMNRAALFLLLALFIAAAKATVHTTCWNYFMNKDGCVFSSADSKTRCNATAKPHPAPVSQVPILHPQIDHQIGSAD